MENQNALRLYRLALLIMLSIAPFNFLPAQTTLYTSGNNLLDLCGDTVVLRGIDYAPYNWGNTLTSEETDQIEKTGANCVRLVWYANGGGAPYYTTADLDTVLTTCREELFGRIIYCPIKQPALP